LADGHVRVAAGLLWVLLALYLLLVAVSVPIYISIAHDDPPFGVSMTPTVQGIVIAAIVDAFFSPLGITALVGALRLPKCTRVGYVAAIIAYGLCCLGCCIPFGGYGLYALLRQPIRQAFFPPAAQAAHRGYRL
jgi:hypothetical protein